MISKDQAEYEESWNAPEPAPGPDEFERKGESEERSLADRLAAGEGEKVADAGGMAHWFNEVRNVATDADADAERAFPDDARDASRKNAFRHAMGTGRLAQLLGADSGVPILNNAAAGAAKVAGYVWESLGGPENYKSEDMRHDLNANAIGTREAKSTVGREELKQRLLQRAKEAREELPPGITDRSPGHLTYTKK